MMQHLSVIFLQIEPSHLDANFKTIKIRYYIKKLTKKYGIRLNNIENFLIAD